MSKSKSAPLQATRGSAPHLSAEPRSFFGRLRTDDLSSAVSRIVRWNDARSWPRSIAGPSRTNKSPPPEAAAGDAAPDDCFIVRPCCYYRARLVKIKTGA
ncbi:hypothetical protein GWI33_005427 [Rhynchophorus ferrugineus]|uniref:Uncharacterized protein n=1 Tax=Rhynchophorus ferrugineus TaxID=354439 RepID=A0A834ILN9_RHYFE|nr:hypothetical protein GWI33_005427 [Rhynchophorus ferrugineus]